MPLPEQTVRELEAIDAALAGEAVDPEYADVAELALLLADSRPALPPARATALDGRFAALAAGRPKSARQARQAAPAGRPWFLRPAWGAGLAVVATLVVLVIVLPKGGGTTNSSSFSGSSSSAGASGAANASGSVHTPASAGTTKAASALGASAPAEVLTVPTPQANGRRIVQSSQLSLTAANPRIATVAQELFNVVGSEQGIVKHSQVSTGTAGYASFTLSIPTANLSATLARLAQLRYAKVASSSASTTDVNTQYLDDQRRLADAKALRSSLLIQLQAAVSTAAIDSLDTQIKDAESTITKDESVVNGLQGRISYSAVSVTISAAGVVAPARKSSGGFTLRRSAHDALDVLKVAAGVALIVLAILVPLGLLAVLVAWLTFGWRRHRRERTLDAG